MGVDRHEGEAIERRPADDDDWRDARNDSRRTRDAGPECFDAAKRRGRLDLCIWLDFLPSPPGSRLREAPAGHEQERRENDELRVDRELIPHELGELRS